MRIQSRDSFQEMSKDSDEEYISADESTNDDELLRSEHSGASQGVTEPSDVQTVNDTTHDATNAEEQQPEVVKVLDNKYVSDAESVKSGGVVELTEEQRKVSTSSCNMAYYTNSVPS